jgi:hypothetical protein
MASLRWQCGIRYVARRILVPGGVRHARPPIDLRCGLPQAPPPFSGFSFSNLTFRCAAVVALASSQTRDKLTGLHPRRLLRE